MKYLCQLAVALLVALILHASYSTATDWKAIVDQSAEKLIEKKRAMGLVVGLLHADGRREYFGYGHTQADGPQPDENSIFEIGSNTKTFTSLVLAELVTRGELKLDTPVAELLPKNWKIPQRGDEPITLVQLATHTAGLPTAPPSLIAQVEKNPKLVLDPYAGYAAEAMAGDLAEIEIKPRESFPAEYSNLGMGLLGYALCQKTGLGYEAMIHKYVTEPLAMPDTAILFAEDKNARRVHAHDAQLKPVPDWMFQDCLAGCGALRSTAVDMLTYLAAQNGQVETPLAGAIKLSHEPQGDAPGISKVALGWFLMPGPAGTQIIVHNGGTGGQSSYAACCIKPAVAVVVLCNSSCPGANDMFGSIGAKLIRQQIEAALAPQAGD